MKKRVVSVVIPVFNEARGVKNFLDGQLKPVLEEIEEKYECGTEVVVVDDGSRDGSLRAILETELLRESEEQGGAKKAEVGGGFEEETRKNVGTSGKRTKREVKLIEFSRNFGKEIALMAGIKYATGDAIVMIDADGQHPVERIIEMVQKWEGGAKIVTAIRKESKTSHRIGSKIFYKMMRMMGSQEVVEGELDFRLIDREVAEEYNKFTEHNRITRGLIDWLGFPQERILVELRGRTEGRGTYGAKKLMALAVDSFVSMSRTPLVIFGYLGVFITSFSFLLGLFILIEQYILGDPMGLDWAGAVAVSVFVSFLVGLVLISQSITAIYVSQIHIEAKNRPLYVIDRGKSRGI